MIKEKYAAGHWERLAFTYTDDDKLKFLCLNFRHKWKVKPGEANQ